MVAYQTAWFKCHHPKEYMAALLTSVLDSTEKVAEYISECRDMDIPLLPPDVNESQADFTVVEGGIRFGLVALKGVGRNVVNAMLSEREKGGLFTDFMDFCDRMFDQDLNRRVVESLIKSGAFDRMGYRRSQLMQVYGQVLDGIAAARKRNVEGQLDLFGLGGVEAVSYTHLDVYKRQEQVCPFRERSGYERYVAQPPAVGAGAQDRRCGRRYGPFHHAARLKKIYQESDRHRHCGG